MSLTQLESSVVTNTNEAYELANKQPSIRSFSAIAAAGPQPVEAPAPEDLSESSAQAWISLAACAVLYFFAMGVIQGFGTINSALVKEGLGNASSVSWVGSVSPGVMALLAIFATRLVRTHGARKIGVIGSCIMGGSVLLSGFAVHSLPALIITGGLLEGIGLSLLFLMTSIVPSQWFKRRRGLANGIVYASGGIGGGTCALMEGAIIDHLGTAKMYWIFGSTIFVCCFSAAWLIKENNPPKQRIYVDKLLLRDTDFILMAIGSGMAILPLFLPPFFLSLYAETKPINLSSGSASTMVAAFNFASAVGRIGFGYLCDAIGPLNSLVAGLLLSAVSLLVIWPVSESLAPLIIFCVLAGAANGSFFAAMPTVVGAIFGTERISVCMGMIITTWTIGYLTGAPIGGALLDAFGGQSAGLQAFRPAMFFSGALTLASAAIMATVRYRKQQRWFVKA